MFKNIRIKRLLALKTENIQNDDFKEIVGNVKFLETLAFEISKNLRDFKDLYSHSVKMNALEDKGKKESSEYKRLDAKQDKLLDDLEKLAPKIQSNLITMNSTEMAELFGDINSFLPSTDKK